MESATLDRLMTRETVAGERSRCSASFFRLIGFRAAWPVASLPDLALPGLDFFVATAQSRTRKSWGQAEISIRLFSAFSLLCSLPSFLLLTSAAKTYFIQTVD